MGEQILDFIFSTELGIDILSCRMTAVICVALEGISVEHEPLLMDLQRV